VKLIFLNKFTKFENPADGMDDMAPPE
jgi:hypothetical protein